VKWKTCLILVSILAAMVLAWVWLRPDVREQARDERTRLAAVFAGDSKAFESLRRQRGQAVEAMEAFLRQQHQDMVTNLGADLSALGSTNAFDRKLAEARLTLAPESCADWLRQQCATLPESEARTRLKTLLAGRVKARKQVTGFLSGLYAEHFNRLFVERRAALERDCHDFEAQLFFAYAPFDQTWGMLKNAAPEHQLRFLLFRVFSGRDRSAVEWLERFSAQDILNGATRTWWPVEIEGVATNAGPGYVVLAGSVGSNVVRQVLKVNLRAGASEWTSLERWTSWTYIFRFKEPCNGRVGVTYQEERVYRAASARRVSWGLPREKPEEELWLPETQDHPVAGRGVCEAVRVFPPSVAVPVAAVTRLEAARWNSGSVYVWSRPLFSEAVRSHLHFEPDRYPPPKVFESMEAASKRQPRRRAT
jgi:hypothetical protein